MKSVAVLVVAASVSFAAPIITIRPAIGPNDISASFGSFVANALSGLQSCVSSTCNVGGSIDTTPTAFNQTSVFSYGDMARTSYSSWRGTAPPAGAFAGEFGNLAYWSVSVIDTTGTFSLHDLGVTQSSTDGTNYFGFADNYASGAGSDYGFDRIGINFGLDGVLGGGDDTVYANGESGGNAINALFFVGIGFGLDGNPWPGPSNQQKLDQLKAQAALDLGTDLVSTCYSVGATTTCADVVVAEAQGDPSTVPEPASVAMIGVGLGGLYLARRRSGK